MYEAKQHGRNSYQSFRKDMNTRLAKRALLESDLRAALGRKEFLLHYQPKIDLQTGLVTGMETLPRWQHRSGECCFRLIRAHRGRVRFDSTHRTTTVRLNVEENQPVNVFGEFGICLRNLKGA
jgi:hypothetical protein